MKQVHSADYEFVFWLRFLSFVHFQYFSIIKKCNKKKVQHGKRSQDASEHLRWRALQQCFTILLIIAAELSILQMFVGVLVTTLEIVQHEKSAIGKNCNMRRV